MYFLEQVKEKLGEEINKALGQSLVVPENFVYPPNLEMGDLSLPCFDLAKEMEKSPVEVANEIAKSVKIGKEIKGAKAAGPYLNIILNPSFAIKNVIEEVIEMEERFGTNESGKKKKVMIEYSNANTHKEYHVGHLRNISYGDSVSRLLSANGYKSIPVSYINDFGIHVAKTLWAYLKFYKDEPLPSNKGNFLGQAYVRATKELENNEPGKKEIEIFMQRIESHKGEEYELWEETRKWSISQFAEIYKELGVEFEHIFYENEFVDAGLKLVAELKAKGFLKDSQGAVIADLEPYGLSVLLFLRSDGTALYPVADVPLAMAKFEKYKLDKSIYVVDIRQSLYFKQLFKVLELLGYKKEMVHLGYDFVKLPSGMMSSRTGNVITYEELKDQMIARTIEETKKRHEDWSSEKIRDVAWKIAVGAIKFEMIKVSPQSMITFDINEALKFDGFTAAYLQYTCARINSIIKKARKQAMPTGRQESKKASFDASKLTEEKEKDLALKMAKYPEIIKKAGENYSPAEVAKYLFELGKEFNDYYHAVPVLKAEEDITIARLALINAVAQVIKNGLYLLGIETVDEM